MNSFSVGQGNLTWVMELLNSINIFPNKIINSFTDYSAYFFWMLVLFLLLFSPVVIILGFIYLSNFLLHIYKIKVNLKEDYLSQSWDNGRRAVAHLWDVYGTVWHGKFNLLDLHIDVALLTTPQWFIIFLKWHRRRICSNHVIFRTLHKCHQVALFNVWGFNVEYLTNVILLVINVILQSKRK